VSIRQPFRKSLIHSAPSTDAAKLSLQFSNRGFRFAKTNSEAQATIPRELQLDEEARMTTNRTDVGDYCSAIFFAANTTEK
jgi:hypothetical protein